MHLLVLPFSECSAISLTAAIFPASLFIRLYSVCECLAMMSEGRLMPQVETIELFIVGVERAYAADPEANTHL